MASTFYQAERIVSLVYIQTLTSTSEIPLLLQLYVKIRSLKVFYKATPKAVESSKSLIITGTSWSFTI